MVHLGGMARWVQTVVLVVVALLTNSQCYARCLAAPSQSSPQAHSGCHHSAPSKQDPSAPCRNQHHFEIANLEAKVDLAKVPITAVSPVAIFFTIGANWSAALPGTISQSLSERASPPDKPLFLTLSVLRL